MSVPQGGVWSAVPDLDVFDADADARSPVAQFQERSALREVWEPFD